MNGQEAGGTREPCGILETLVSSKRRISRDGKAGNPQTDVFDLVTFAQHPLATALLESFGGLVLILDEARRVVAANSEAMAAMGFPDSESLCGLEMGEALRCMHLSDAPNGCGSGKACSTCGSSVAFTSSITTRTPVERECLMLSEIAGQEVSFDFRVRATPMELEGQNLTILTLQDIQAEKQNASMHQVFFHDLMNVMTGLCGSADLAARTTSEDERDRLVAQVRRLAHDLVDDARAFQELCKNDASPRPAKRRTVLVQDIFDSLNQTFYEHPLSQGKTLTLDNEDCKLSVFTDKTLVERVLSSMLKNALEASDTDDRVQVWCTSEGRFVTFHVWNRKAIAPGVAPRIFQRHFSTKSGTGRGLGTYSMKFFGEKRLGGRVWFTSTKETGTEFCLSLETPSKRDSHLPTV